LSEGVGGITLGLCRIKGNGEEDWSLNYITYIMSWIWLNILTD
jgi:hypothetical protein